MPDGVFVLRDLDDALALRAALAGRPRLAVVGAGFVGCEVAATARKQGLDVTLIDIAPQPMTPLGPDVGARVAELHRSHGVTLRLGVGVDGFDGDGSLQAVRLADGTRVEADVAVVALGAAPNTEWLAGSGLQIQPGVLCDATLAARGAEGVFCAGDAAAWPHPMAGGDVIRIEHWTNAAEQGAAAARNLLAAPADRVPYAAVPYFWSDQYDIKLQAVGLAGRAQRMRLLEATPDGDKLVLGGERDGRLVAVVGFNAARRLTFYRRQLAEMPPIDDVAAAVAADPKALGAPVPGMRALILMHGDWGPPGLLAEWLGARGIAFDVHRTYEDAPWPDPADYDLVASLGSNRNPRDTDDPAVAGELALAARRRRRRRARPRPLLRRPGARGRARRGGRAGARAGAGLGGDRDGRPGGRPAGPWLSWHYDRFALPEGAVELARTPAAIQAFRHGRHLGVQFHPESTPEIVLGWAHADTERLAALGHGDGAHLIAATPDRRAAARTAAFALFDGFLATAYDPVAPAAAVREG